MAATSPLLASGPLGLTCRHASASRAAGHPSSRSLPSSQEELESKAALLRAALQAALPGLLIREVIASGGISICFEALDRRSGELRAVKVTHQGVSCQGSAKLIATLAEVLSCWLVATCMLISCTLQQCAGCPCTLPLQDMSCHARAT